MISFAIHPPCVVFCIIPRRTGKSTQVVLESVAIMTMRFEILDPILDSPSTSSSPLQLVTILAQGDVPALQILDAQGRWIAAPIIPGTFVCNIGDQLHQWTSMIRLFFCSRVTLISPFQMRSSNPRFIERSIDQERTGTRFRSFSQRITTLLLT